MGFDLKDFTKNSDGSYSKKTTAPQPRDVAKAKGKKPHAEVQQEVFESRVATNGANMIFRWADKHISLNDWYSSKHWTHRNKIKDEWCMFFTEMIPKPYPTINKYTLELRYNSRLDPSNTIPMPKILEDTLQKLGILKNDNKKFCKGLSLIPDETMKKNSYSITLTNISQDE